MCVADSHRSMPTRCSIISATVTDPFRRLSASTSKDPLFFVTHVPPSTATYTSVRQHRDAVLEANRSIREKSTLACPAPRRIIVFLLRTACAVQHVSSICPSRVVTKKELSSSSVVYRVMDNGAVSRGGRWGLSGDALEAKARGTNGFYMRSPVKRAPVLVLCPNVKGRFSCPILKPPTINTVVD